MILSIIIEADDLSELFAVGPLDLKAYFLPEWFGVKADAVKQVVFKEVTERDESGLPIKSTEHVDNIYRKTRRAETG